MIPLVAKLICSQPLEHLLGIESNKFLQVGQDMLSPDHDQIVAFRSANYFVTPEYTSYSGRTYYTKTGEEITNPDENTKEQLDKIREAANLQLRISDSIQTGDLLRFFKGNDLGKVNPEDYSYTNSFKTLKKIEKEKGDNQPAFIINVATSPPLISSRHQLIKNCTQKAIVLPQQRPVAVLLNKKNP